MGEIKKAYDYLNKSLKLGLKPEQILRAEAGFKLDLGRQEKFPAALRKSAMAFSADWEIKGTLVPRRTPLARRITK